MNIPTGGHNVHPHAPYYGRIFDLGFPADANWIRTDFDSNSDGFELRRIRTATDSNSDGLEQRRIRTVTDSNSDGLEQQQIRTATDSSRPGPGRPFLKNDCSLKKRNTF